MINRLPRKEGGARGADDMEVCDELVVSLQQEPHRNRHGRRAAREVLGPPTSPTAARTPGSAAASEMPLACAHPGKP
ncbi:hypothetical protein LFM09_37055 [Lentzea alba]|uniref:hypothetical protein n=1 Tax=Lentzea alba TaxID=2714351 RepID=UPI0039BF6168